MFDLTGIYNQFILHPWLFYGTVLIFSLMIGSFLNVVVYRLPKMMYHDWEVSAKEILDQTSTQPEEISPAVSANTPTYNLFWPASTCPHCNTHIKPWHNIPILSYLWLKGRCHNCNASISIRYPIIESLTAILSIIVAVVFGPTPQLLSALVLTWCLWSLSIIDYDHKLLPDQITLPLLWLGLLLNINQHWVSLQSAVIGAAAGYLCLWSVYWVFKLTTKKEGMGYGDFKLLAAMGAWMGWEAIPTIILLSSLVGSVVGIGLIIITKRDRNHAIPFGPYLAAAGWLYFLWGDTIDVQKWLFS